VDAPLNLKDNQAAELAVQILDDGRVLVALRLLVELPRVPREEIEGDFAESIRSLPP
jgi:hypothetical protein